MGQTLVQNYLHIVFSTKNRQPLIHSEIEERLHAYIGGICNELECPPIKVGGDVDHIHILTALSKNIALKDLLGKIKANSTNWLKSIDPKNRNFSWQNGYGAFSVDPKGLDKVISYIANQHEHHRRKSFQDELRTFLKAYAIEFDEKFVWR